MKYCRNKFAFSSKNGFTLLEILVTIAVTSILFTIGMAKYRDFNKTQTLKSAVLELKNNLRDVQARAYAGIKPSSCTTTFIGYGVSWFSTTEYRAYADCATDVPIKSYTLPKGIEFISSFSNVKFKLLSQGVDSAGDITIELISPDLDKMINLVIGLSGQMKESDVLDAI